MKSITEQLTTRIIAEVLSEDRQHFPGTPGGPYISPDGYDTPPYLAPTQQGRPVVTPYDPNQGLSGLDDDLVPTYFDRPPPQHPSGDPIPIKLTIPVPGSGQVTYIFQNGDILVVFGDERPDIFAPGDSFTTNNPDWDARFRHILPDSLKPFVPGGNPIEDLIHDFSDDG